jgi:hypothetical protein
MLEGGRWIRERVEVHWKATSTSGIPPRRLCSSRVSRPPLKACLLILFLDTCQRHDLNAIRIGKAHLDLVRGICHENCRTASILSQRTTKYNPFLLTWDHWHSFYHQFLVTP